MMDLLKFIPRSKHDYNRNLRTNRHDEISKYDVHNEEDITIYLNNGSV